MADIIDIKVTSSTKGGEKEKRNSRVKNVHRRGRSSIPSSPECSIPAGTMTPRRGNKSDIWKRERSLAATRPPTIIESIEAETNRRRVPTSRLSLLLRYLGSWYLHFYRANHRRTGAVSRSVPPFSIASSKDILPIPCIVLSIFFFSLSLSLFRPITLCQS